MPLNIIVTDAGRAAIVNAENTGTAPVTIAQVGVSATALAPTAAATALPGEIKRLATLSGDVVADDTIHLSVTDSSADAYVLRSFALYLANGTLFAIYGQADPVLNKTAASVGLLAIDVIFADISAASLTFGSTAFINPPATTERVGVVELATVAEAQAGIDALRALTAAGAKAAVLGWLLSQDGPGSGLDADLLDGKDWTGGQDVRFGVTDVATPNAGTTGGLRLRGNGTTGYGYVQITSAALAQWGFMRFSAGGELDWYGTGGLRDNGSRVWTVANDGAGSGLDADLLDGQDSAFYTNIPARLGYNPLNAVAYTAADVLGKLVTIDGAGSGLDADLLDGKDWAGGQDVRFGMTDVSTPNDSTTGGLRLRANPVSGFAYLQITNSAASAQWGVARYSLAGEMDWYGAGGLRDNGNRVWHIGNDGAGSGLDADLLDGLNSNQFLRITDASIGVNGFIKVSHALLANDLILQWVNVACSAGGGSAFTWPTPFPHRLMGVVPGGRQGLTYSGSYSAYASGADLLGGTAFGNNGGGAGSTVTLFALGD
jgi:hypothetical protein